MRRILLIIIIATISGSFVGAQDCIFNMYIRKGSQYYFSTFYSDYSYKQPMQDTCTQNLNGKPYQTFIFKDGIIQEEKLYFHPNNVLYSEYKRYDLPHLISEYISYEADGRLKSRFQYYYDNGHHRCMKETTYHYGKIFQERSFRTIHTSELAAAGYQPRPDHVIDSEGYTDLQVQIGEEINYSLNGQTRTVQQFTYRVSDNPNYNSSRTGNFYEYDKNNNILKYGFFSKDSRTVRICTIIPMVN